MMKGGYGPNVAAAAGKLKLKSTTTENGFLVEDYLGGQILPPVTFAILDTFGQVITTGSSNTGELILEQL